jgi:aconitate hydratase
LGLTGHETFDIMLPDDIHPHQLIEVVVSSGKKFQVITRFDTDVDVAYYKNGGILNCVVRKLIE